ncbi:hypothetical protein CDD83_1635 [Cordyceps sp. RAO-2017]|nr:hypothetical protein CDD83_1635 [Cordyceps sp. RAO-2017]
MPTPTPPPPDSPGSASSVRRPSDATAGPVSERLRRSSAVLTASPFQRLTLSSEKEGFRSKMGLAGVARRTLGIGLLLVTVFLWTTSNFLASFIFSDHTYDKPFFLVYVNSSVFAVALLPVFVRYMRRSGIRGLRHDVVRLWHEHRRQASMLAKLPSAAVTGREAEEELAGTGAGTARERLLLNADGADDDDDDDGGSIDLGQRAPDEKLGFRETAGLSLEFCMLWTLANYFASACLEHTSVASVTILTSTSSMWTLVFCAVYGVEAFSVRKLVGVMASLVGVALISTVDLSGESDENRGSFPHKTPGQIAVGDAMALFSAVVYGMYVTVMKRRVGSEDRVDMRLFFGLVGVFNLALLWPLFFVLHWTGIEPFEMPPTGKVWAVIIANSLASFVSDMSWAMAMLLTTPLVVTVGLSLTIPLSLVGEMIQYGQYSSFIYWIGAAVVFVSFLFINNESYEDGGPGRRRGSEDGSADAAAARAGAAA